MNKAFLIGNLTKDPELRTTPSGVNVCSFSIAVNRRFSNQAGEREVDYFNIIAWRGLGDNCAKYLAKGRKVSIVGEIQNRSYDGKDGVKRYITEIVADDVEFLTPRDKDGTPGSYQGPTPPQAGGQRSFSGGNAPSGEGFTDVGEDDLPF